MYGVGQKIKDKGEFRKMGLTKAERELEERRMDAELAKKNQEDFKRAFEERVLMVEGCRTFNIHDTDAENKFLQTKLLEKWDNIFQTKNKNIFQRKNIIDKLKFFEYVEEKKRFIAVSFSIEVTTDSWKVEDINCLELVYESQGNQLVFKFTKKENLDFVLCLEYKTAQESNNIKTEITGTANNATQYYGLYGFLYSLGNPETAAHMEYFFTRLEEAEQKLPNKKYLSALDSLSTL